MRGRGVEGPQQPEPGGRRRLEPAPRRRRDAVSRSRLALGARGVGLRRARPRLGAAPWHAVAGRPAGPPGAVRRVASLFHWRNEGYAAPAAFLARLDSKHRHQARRERAAPAAQGITIRTISGEELARDRRHWAEAAYALHRSTVDKLMW